MHFIAPQLARDAWQKSLSEFIWGNTLFCCLVQHMKKKNTNPFPPLRKACFRAEWNFEPWQIMLLLLIHLSPWAPSAVLGALSVAQIKINGFSMTTELTEHIPCGGCAVWLFPTLETPQQVSFTVSPGKWPLWRPHHLPSSLPHHFAIALPAVNGKLDGCFSQAL